MADNDMERHDVVCNGIASEICNLTESLEDKCTLLPTSCDSEEFVSHSGELSESTDEPCDDAYEESHHSHANVQADAEDVWGWGDDEFEENVSQSIMTSKESAILLDDVSPRAFTVGMSCSSDLLANAFAHQTGVIWSGAVAIHSLADRLQPRRLSSALLPSSISNVRFLDDNTLLASCDDGSLMTVHLPNEVCRDTYYKVSGISAQVWEHDSVINCVEVSHAKTRVVSCDDKGRIIVWAPSVLAVLESVVGHWPQVDALVIKPDLERQFVTYGGHYGELKFWDDTMLLRKIPTKPFLRCGNRITTLSWLDSNSLLFGTTDGSVNQLDVRFTNDIPWSCQISSGKMKTGALKVCSLLDQSIFSISEDNFLRKFSLHSKEVVSEWNLYPSIPKTTYNDHTLTDICPAFEGKNIICCCRDQMWWMVDENDKLVKLSLGVRN